MAIDPSELRTLLEQVKQIRAASAKVELTSLKYERAIKELLQQVISEKSTKARIEKVKAKLEKEKQK